MPAPTYSLQSCLITLIFTPVLHKKYYKICNGITFIFLYSSQYSQKLLSVVFNIKTLPNLHLIMNNAKMNRLTTYRVNSKNTFLNVCFFTLCLFSFFIVP